MISDPQMELFELKAASQVLRKVKNPCGDVMRYARKALSMRQTEFAEALEVRPETVSRWENGRLPISKMTAMAVVGFLEITARGERGWAQRTTT